ncbi:hypothetical protein L1049_005471 [Liquidambar formosana]|uniref:Uncharacterized protein n=1 Tax=Liquidambar formosana TaxID=63359 RepID=A0AAP0X1U0_LIQFO
MVFLSNAINFVAYFQKSMHYPSAKSANMVTNFMGTSFLLTIFGGFISDSFFTRFTTFIIFCMVELLLNTRQFQPAIGRRPSRAQAAILYTGLYAMATGVGGIKASLPAHGADQLDRNNQRSISAFFNWYFFSLCTGGLVAATVMVWVEENEGWKWSFKISVVALTLALCIFASGFPIYRYKPPSGSPVARIFKVEHSFSNACAIIDSFMQYMDRALIDDTISTSEVEETKTFLGLLPIFASTIMMNCCLAQLQTFSVQQGLLMNKTISHNFTIPTQSLSVFPLTIMLASIPLYERFVRLFGHKFSSNTKIFQPLCRIGLGLALASGSMAVAAAVEAKRREAAQNNVSSSVFWLGWQYLLLGVSDMLTLGGMLEFFYVEAPDRMRSICTALSWCSTSMGYFISSALVGISNAVSGRFGREWLGGNDLNHARLDLFYALLCVLNFINFLNYVYWAKRY